MAGEIQRAKDRFDAKADAAEHLEGEAAIRSLISGLDLGYEELRDFSQAMSEMRVDLAGQGYPLRGMFGSTLSEGIVLGLLIAEEREKAGAR
jgi:hypothetical protein